MRPFIRALSPLLALSILVSCEVSAHSLGASYLSIESAQGHRLAVRWEIAIGDLQTLIDLDADASGTVTSRELDESRERIAATVLPLLEIHRAGRACVLEARDQLVNERSDGYYAVLTFAGACGTNGTLGITYRMLFDVDRSHRALVSVNDNGHSDTRVLSPGAPSWFPDAAPGPSFASFVAQGTHHIWIGYDHIAFLALLLLPAALRSRSGGWVAAQSAREVALRTLAIVSAFTLAHSLTLSLAATGVLAPAQRPIEAAIAASVVLAGLANLVPRIAAHVAWLAFGFGLVHGFGFANVLQELGLQRGSLALSLAGFNVGVELGQLAIVLVLLPLLYRARTSAFYQLRFVPAASLATGVLALGWFLDRIQFQGTP
jgi:hypothetical protein